MKSKDMADYRDAPSGLGPLAAEWKDKPHRLLYDLITEVDSLRRGNMTSLSRLQTKTKLMLMRVGLFGGLAWIVADKIAHALGLGCLGL